MFSRIAVVLGLHRFPRRDDLDDRATVLSLFARFTDELGSGLLVVLMPTLRARLGLSITQVGWCFQALFTAGALVEPVAAVAIDLTRRRPLLVAGAAGWAGALSLAAGAGTFGWLLVAFGLAGAAYGPLVNTADVLLVDAHPDAVERIATRTTVVDTIGAVLPLATVAVAGRAGLDQRILLVAAGTAVLGYALLLAGAVVPAPAPPPHGTTSALRRIGGNVRQVWAVPQARTWITALLLIEALDVTAVFEPVWLAGVVGVSQALVAVHVAVGMAATLLALVGLDRWLAHHDDPMRVLLSSIAATLLLYPAWLLVPGYLPKLGLVALRGVAVAPLWPVVHARALAAVPGRGGAVAAVVALAGLVPLHAAFGWVAAQVGLTATLLAVQTAACLALLCLLRHRTAIR